MCDIGFVNDIGVIQQNNRVTAINSAVEVDLTGQIVSDSMGHRMYSGVGGQVALIKRTLTLHLLPTRSLISISSPLFTYRLTSFAALRSPPKGDPSLRCPAPPATIHALASLRP